MEEKEITPVLSQVRSLLCLTLSHLKSNASDNAIKKSFDALIEKIQNTDTEAVAATIRNDYRSLIMKMDIEDTSVQKGAKKSLLSKFFQKEKKDEPLQELIRVTENLLNAFAKGSLLIVNEKSSLYKTVSEIRAGGYKDYTETQISEFGQKILAFFMSQSWENEMVTRERTELKNIIAILASNIQEFGAETKSFETGLSNYAKKIESASSLEDIVKAKQEILFETEKIRQANQTVNQKLEKAKEKVEVSTTRIKELEKELEKVELEKIIDHLTQTYNRRALDRRIDTAIRQVKGDEKMAGLIMFDLDNFKKFNDTYGHRAGDQVIKTVAMLSKEVFEDGGFVGRYGGKEFAVVFFEKSLSRCLKRANELLKNISAHEFIYKKKTIRITVSIGVTMVSEKDTIESAYERVDKFLYQAKKNGKNRVIGK